MRRWTATIKIGSETFTASQSDSDLQSAQLKASAREAGEMLKAGIGTSDAILGDTALVRLLKTTGAGTRSDIGVTVWIGDDGRVRTQR